MLDQTPAPQTEGTEISQTDEAPTFNAAVATTAAFAGQLLRLALDELRQLPELWPQTSESKQTMVINRLRSGFEGVIARNMTEIMAIGLPHVEVGLQSVAAKGDAIKATVLVPAGKMLHDLIDVMGRKVTLVLVDVAKYAEGMETFKAQADQRELELGKSSDSDDEGEGVSAEGPPAGSASEKQQTAAEAQKTPEELAAENTAFANGLAASLGTHVNGQGAIDGTSEASRNARRRNARG